MQKKEQIEITLTAILVLVLGILVFPYLTGQLKIKSAKFKTEPVEYQSPAENLDKTASLSLNTNPLEKVLFAKLEEIAEKISFNRDPFNPLPQENEVHYGLQGILWEQAIPMAIINNEVVKVGDKVEKATVVDIRKDAVFLNTGKKIIQLKLETE